MAGLIAVSDDLGWSVNSWMFYWEIEAIATSVRSEQLRAQLEEIVAEHLGWLDLRAFPEHDREELIGGIRASAEERPGEAPVSAGRLEEIRRLIDMVDRVYGNEDDPPRSNEL